MVIVVVVVTKQFRILLHSQYEKNEEKFISNEKSKWHKTKRNERKKNTNYACV